ncbi:MAG: LPS assembly lipoprotein LptE [Gammaproteobacteria bacterium]|nr:LPS assembly lipoprotein LptE [Gammaproteobacteria bacterium]
MPVPLTRLLLLLPAVLATACGWHLRGASTMPEGVSNVHVQAPNKSLRDAWNLQLSENGVNVSGTSQGSDALLVVEQETFDRRVLSVDPDTGKVREFVLAYTATVRVDRADGSVLLEPYTVRQVRNFVFDERAVIGGENEQNALYREMRLSAVQQVMRRIQLASCGKPGQQCVP